MDPAHRDILRRHRGRIVDDLNVDRVKDSLIQNRIFGDGHWDDIATAGKGTRLDKASALMDELPRRGPRAFWCFCESLMTEGYEYLAEPLIEEVYQKVPTRILALLLREQISRIKQEYQEIVKKRRVPVMRALKKVGQIKKTGGRGSDTRVTSLKHIERALESHKLKHIKEALESHKDQKDLARFNESEASALTDILDMVWKLADIRNKLQRDGSVPEYAGEINSLLAHDFSDLYEKTINKGIDYMKDLRKQGVNDSDIKNFGSVLVLIPYLCDLSERAVKVMMRFYSLPGVEDFPTSQATAGAYMQTPDYEEKFEEPVSPLSEELGQEDEATLFERLKFSPTERKLQTESCTVTVPPGAASETTLQVISPNDVTIPLNDGEMLVSDVIELGPLGTTFHKPVTVQMQYHGISSDGTREPVMLVTEDKSQWKVLTITAKSEGELIGSINHSCTFVIVAQLKKDQFSVSSKRTRVTSSTHPAVQIIFPEKSVPTPIEVNIQVQDVPKETIEAVKVNLKHRRGLISTSPIVNVETDSTVKFDKPVTVRVPHPQHYMGTRHIAIGSPKLRVMSRDEGAEDWVDVTNDVNIRVLGDFVEFTVNHFTSYVVLEVESSSGDLVELGRIPLEMCKWIHQCDVKFILLQQEDNPNALLIECHKASEADREFAKLKSRGYKGTTPSETVRLLEGQRVEVSLVGNVSFASFCRFSKHLVFHSKMNPRLNIVAKADQVRGEEGLEGVGYVEFLALPKILVEKTKERRVRALCNYRSSGKRERSRPRQLCYIPIKLPYQRQQTTEINVQVGEGASAERFASTGVYEYFYFIKEGVSTKWGDLAFHLGFKWADITNIAGRNRDDKTSCMDMLCEWQSREGNGATIEVLKEALLKSDLRNVVDELNDKFFST